MLDDITAVVEAINSKAGYEFVSAYELKWYLTKVEVIWPFDYEVFALQKGATTILVHPVKVGDEIRYAVEITKW